jgi:hypothetical protein
MKANAKNPDLAKPLAKSVIPAKYARHVTIQIHLQTSKEYANA